MRATLLASLALLAATAPSQRPIRTITGTHADQNFGTAMLVVEDHDGDGWRDVVYGVPGHAGAGLDAGALRAVSTLLVRPLGEVRGSGPGERFGTSLAAVGDLDNDQRTEIIAGGPGHASGAGRIEVLRWVPGTGYVRLWQRTGSAGQGLGSHVAGIGDFDADGDLDVAAIRSSGVDVFDGATGALVASITTIFTQPSAIAAMGRVDASSGDEFALATASSQSEVQIRGRTGLVRRMSTPYPVTGLAGTGDVDGDGIPDVAAGGPDLFGPGYVTWFSGASGGVIRTLRGETGVDGFGTVLASGHDVNGDGVNDLVVGAATNDNFGRDAGCAYVFSGDSGVMLAVVNGTASSENLGMSAALGGPGMAHGVLLLAGAPRASAAGLTEAGQVRVFHADLLPTAGTFQGQPLQGLGWAVAGIGDVDGDGRDDFAFSAPTADRSTGLRAGAVSVVNSTGVARVFDGSGLEARYGRSIGRIGDYDGDGFADLLALELTTQVVRIDSPATGARLLTHMHGGFNAVVAGIGDADADGIPDFAVGQPYHNNDAGRVLVYAGRTGTVRLTLNGNSRRSLGFAVAGIGDVDGDGHDDLVASAPGDFAFLLGAEVTVYSGFDGRVLHQHRAGNTRLGHSVAGAGDVDRDGVPDYLVTEPWANNDFGTVILYSGRTHGQLRTWSGSCIWDRSTFVAGLGDVNGDGVPDVGMASETGGFVNGLRIASGRDGATLAAYLGGCGSSQFSIDNEAPIGAIGDSDGDGFADYALGSYYGTGIVRKFAPFGLAGTLPRVHYLGAGCPGNRTGRPTITATPPALGTPTTHPPARRRRRRQRLPVPRRRHRPRPEPARCCGLPPARQPRRAAHAAPGPHQRRRPDRLPRRRACRHRPARRPPRRPVGRLRGRHQRPQHGHVQRRGPHLRPVAAVTLAFSGKRKRVDRRIGAAARAWRACAPSTSSPASPSSPPPPRSAP